MRNPFIFRSESSERAGSVVKDSSRGLVENPVGTITSSLHAKEHDKRMSFAQEDEIEQNVPSSMPSGSEAGCMQAQMVDVFFSNEKPTNENYTLKGVNINVMKGEIYALLGPSGCGKTTVLKCFTKIIKPNSGEVWLSQNESEDSYGTGFSLMPQELSLFPELTIEETLVFFSKIYSVPSTELYDRIRQFSDLIQLPPRNRQIGQLSGGQQRRVSFVCALLRDAPLLILDEPTVGLDPIARQTIWKYLIELTSKMNKTVILTTHYIEEAKDANTVGLMRDGQVLIETSPRELMRKFGENSLEKCFYKIYVNSESSIPEEKAGCSEDKSLVVKCSRGTESESLRHRTPSEAHRHKSGTKKIQARYSRTGSNIGCLTMKNMKNLKRYPLMMFIQFAIPSVVVILCRICISDNITHLKVAIINEEDPPYLSKIFLEELNTHSVIQTNYSTLQEGIDSVKSGDNLVAVHFHPDFSYCLLHTTNLGIFSNNATVDCAAVKLYMDTTSAIVTRSLHEYMAASYNRLKTSVLVMLDANPRLASIPIQFVKPIYGSLDVKFQEFVIPAALLFIIYALQGLYTSVSLLMERASGVFDRLQVSGVSQYEIFTAQIITSFFVVVGQIIIMLTVEFGMFNSEIKGSVVLAMFIIFIQGFCGALYGFFVSSLTKEITTGMVIGIGFMYSTIVLCGFLWPVESIPYAVRALAYMVPVTLSIESLRSIMYRGWGLSHQSVWLGITSIIGSSTFFLIMGLLIYKMKK